MKKLVCYTCCTGGYDNISQYEVINPNWDYVYFTDNEELIKQKRIGHWEIRPLAFSKLTNVKNARWHKVNAHILFPEYEYSLWLNANITIKSENVINKIKQLIKEDTLFSVPLHPNRNCIYDEAKVIIDLDIDYSKIVKSEIKFLKKEKYPTTNGLHETCILFRKHNQLKNTLDLWWKMIKSYSKRDQLSFDYAIWKNNISVLPLYEKGTEHRTNGDFVFRYGNNHNQDKIKCKNFAIFKKIKKPNGRRQIYFCGIKIFSYKKKRNKNFIESLFELPINSVCNLYINYRLKKCKYVHFMHTEKFTEPMMQFINNNFNSNEHLYLCELAEPFSRIPKLHNSVRLRTMSGLNFNRENIQKIIHHGLFRQQVLDWLYAHPDISRTKCYWVIWGGDLYGAYGNQGAIPNSTKDIEIRQNFKGYITAFDKDKACQMLNLDKDKFHTAYVSCPINKEIIEKTKKTEHDYIQIQVNHSCNETTLEMLEILSKWKHENIRITTVLSYGDMNCFEKIKQTGKRIFGDKFSYLEHMVSPQEYAQFLEQNDILILNHNRQQGMGNTFTSLNLGTKIFIKSDISTFKFFQQEKIKVFDTYEIKNMSFDEFILYSQKEENIKKAQKYYDNDYLASLWKQIFDKN